MDKVTETHARRMRQARMTGEEVMADLEKRWLDTGRWPAAHWRVEPDSGAMPTSLLNETRANEAMRAMKQVYGPCRLMEYAKPEWCNKHARSAYADDLEPCPTCRAPKAKACMSADGRAIAPCAGRK